MTRRALRLVRLTPPASVEVVRCLQELLEKAEAGKITGICFAGIASNREVFYSACGEAHRNPVIAAGLAGTLHHGTMKRVFKEEP